MLTIYPTSGFDSLVSLVDSAVYITNYSTHSSMWLALDDSMKETYLRIATDRVLNTIDTTLLEEDECLKKATSLIAVKDLAFGISSEINPNTGAIAKEKVGDIEKTYFHGYTNRQVKTLDKNPFPSSIIPCLNLYGANLSINGIKQATFIRS